MNVTKMETTDTPYSNRVYLQRLLEEGVRDGKYILDTPELFSYFANNDNTGGDIGAVSNSLQFFTPEGVELTDGWDANEVPVYLSRFLISEVEELLATRYKN